MSTSLEIETLSKSPSQVSIHSAYVSFSNTAQVSTSLNSELTNNVPSLNPNNNSNSSLASASTSNGYFSGYLMKWTNYIKGYQKRWFVLNNGLLSYFR